MARLILRLLLIPALALIHNSQLYADCSPEPSRWDDYKTSFMQDDGRIVDINDTGKSTSEGQAYALFHALVANDQAAYDSIYQWTVNNLADGQLEHRLPAWKWGKRTDGSWGKLDENSAADADIWLAYNLLEAGRLWQRPDLEKAGKNLLQRIAAEEVVNMPGLGPMLLPGKSGFALSQCQWRINPSYLPIQLLRLFATHDQKGPWADMAVATQKLILGASPKGIVPDWVVYDEDQGFITDPEHGHRSSYDAIRNYLWIGMLADEEPLKKKLVKQLGFDCRGKCWPPRFSDSQTGERYGHGSPGFSAAVIPWLSAQENQQCLNRQNTRIANAEEPPAANRHDNTMPNYYDENLKLFALNWQQGKLRFTRSGQLQPQWEDLCQ
ncbi:MAG: cellulose synthase complex periplasmic endoglucanase BcsZ [bacterium]